MSQWPNEDLGRNPWSCETPQSSTETISFMGYKTNFTILYYISKLSDKPTRKKKHYLDTRFKVLNKIQSFLNLGKNKTSYIKVVVWVNSIVHVVVSMLGWYTKNYESGYRKTKLRQKLKTSGFTLFQQVHVKSHYFILFYNSSIILPPPP